MNWKLWGEFCNITRREERWAEFFLSEFGRLIKDKKILDIGSGTGQFAQSLSTSAGCQVTCLDNADYRIEQKLPFINSTFEAYEGEKPDLLLFKQSFHLIDDGFLHLAKYPTCSVCIIQMPRPSWDNSPKWFKSPYDIRKNFLELEELGGRYCFLLTKSITLTLPPDKHEELVLGGYTSDLGAMSLQERKGAWDKIKRETPGKIDDTLEFLWAGQVPK